VLFLGLCFSIASPPPAQTLEIFLPLTPLLVYKFLQLFPDRYYHVIFINVGYNSQAIIDSKYIAFLIVMCWCVIP